MADGPADAAAAWIGPLIGLGVGITAVNMLDRAAGGNVFGSRAPIYVIYINGIRGRSYKNFYSARIAADQLRKKGAVNVVVYSE